MGSDILLAVLGILITVILGVAAFFIKSKKTKYTISNKSKGIIAGRDININSHVDKNN